MYFKKVKVLQILSLKYKFFFSFTRSAHCYEKLDPQTPPLQGDTTSLHSENSISWRKGRGREVSAFVSRVFTCPKTVTRPGTNWAQCRVTTLIEANALPQITDKGKGTGKWVYITTLLQAHTQDAQVWITQFYLQFTPYLPLPRKHSPDGATTDCSSRHLIAAYYLFID